MDYDIMKTIAAGEYAKTLLAEQKDTGKQVIIKQLSLSKTSDWKIIELFRRECSGLKELNHPNIPNYIDHFESEIDGDIQLSLVQEFISGENLKDKIKNGTHLTDQELFSIIQNTLEILDYLHTLNPPIIHRDIKPSNLIFTPSGSTALIDFGAIQKELSGYTGGSTVIGTTGYMPPEQLMGKATPQSDLYALGATIVFLVTHKSPSELPFERMQIQYEAYADISTPLKQFIDKMIASDSSKRFQTPQEALVALQRVKNGQELVIQQAKHRQKQHQKSKKSKAGIIIAGIIIAILFLMVFLFFFIEQSNQEYERAIKEIKSTNTESTITVQKPPVASALDSCIRIATKKPSGQITQRDLDRVTNFKCNDMGVRSLNGIERMPNIKFLDLSKNSIKDLSPLLKLTQIYSLSINFNQISDLDVIKHLPQLERVYAYHNNIKKIPDISKTKITHLALFSNPLEDISGVQNSKTLKHLSVSHSPLDHISALKDVKNLESIAGTYTKISDLSPLKELTQLTKIEFGNAQISDLSPLRNLTRMEWISIGDNQINDLTPLRKMEDLEWLSLSNNEIISLKPLKNMVRLKTLWISGNSVKSLEGLESCNALESLYLYKNRVSDLSPIKNLKRLKKLDITNNYVTNLSPLKNLERLEKLTIKGNNISDLSFVKSVKKIVKD